MIFLQQRPTGVASWTVGLSLVSALSNQRCTLSGAEIRLWNVNSKTVKTEQRRRDAGCNMEYWMDGMPPCSRDPKTQTQDHRDICEILATVFDSEEEDDYCPVETNSSFSYGNSCTTVSQLEEAKSFSFEEYPLDGAVQSTNDENLQGDGKIKTK